MRALLASLVIAFGAAAQAPPDTLDLFLIAGQSNALGAGGDVTLAPVPDRGTAYWTRLRDGELALVPVGIAHHASNGSLGPAFARRYYERTGRPVALLQTAFRGTPVVALVEEGNGHWSAKRPGLGPRGGPDRLAEAVEAVAAVRARQPRGPAGSGPYAFRAAGVIWVQGEADATGILRRKTTEVDYRNGLALTTAALRAAAGDSLGQAPLYLVQTGRPLPADNRGYRSVRRAQEHGAAAGWYTLACDHAVTFAETGRMTDNAHWDQEALNHVGEHVAEAAATDAPPPYEPPSDEEPQPTAAEDGPQGDDRLPYPNPARPGQFVRGLPAGAPVHDALGRLVGHVGPRGGVEAPRAPGVYASGGVRFAVYRP